MGRFDRIERGVVRCSGGLAILGGAGLLFATVLTCVSILMRLARRGLDWAFASYYDTVPWAGLRPILGEEELVSFAVGFALFAALPWVMVQKGHIRVDLFEPLFGDRLNKVLDLAGDVALAVLAYLIFTRQWFAIFSPARRSQPSMGSELAGGNWGILADRLRDNQESQILGITLWPTYVVAQICVGLFLIVALFCVWRSARALWRGWADV